MHSIQNSRINKETLMKNILEVKDLVVEFHTDQGRITAVNGISLDLQKGQTLGIVGESGSGKSVSALSIMRLIPTPPGKISRGTIHYQGENLLNYSPKRMRDIRGRKISMIFQEPMTSLNPVFTIGNQIEEVLKIHGDKLSRLERKEKILECLKHLGIPSPEKRIYEYPHQLSGGMRQRIMIAIGLICGPDVLIADEPTTALDVTIQIQILELMKRLQQKYDMGIIFITHDLGVVAEICDKAAVMYCGKIVETATVENLFHNPKHPYTKGLMESIPSRRTKKDKSERLLTIRGSVPSLHHLPKGCNFQNRCQYATEKCRGQEGEPKLREFEAGHYVSCFHPL